MATLPLIRRRRPDALFARRGALTVTAAQFIADARALAARLPERSHVVNLCGDRYRFAVGFAAALLRGQICLLPPNHTPDLVARLKAAFPGVYALRDDEIAGLDLETCILRRFDATPAPGDPVPELPADRIAAIVFTSGSTGEPVPNPKRWDALVRSAEVEARRLGVLDRGDLTVLGTVPAQHMYGFESTMMIALHGGVVLDAARPFFPADVAAELRAIEGARVLVTTPVHLRALLGEATPLPVLELVVCATAPLAPELAEQAELRYGAPVFEIYGCTEAGQVATRRTTTGEPWQAYDGLHLFQRGDTTLVAGGHVAGEVPLADVIELESPTRFRLQGRTSDLVNIAGKRASLANLNHHLNAIPGVREGVFIVPDDVQDDRLRLAAFVVAPGLDAAWITHALRERIDAVFLPRPLLMVDALPRNETGKLPRAALLRMLAAARTGH